MASPKKPSAGDAEPKPRKPAAKKSAAAKAPAKPRAPRAPKPKGQSTTPAKPRAGRKKAAEAENQLSLELNAAPPVEPKRRAPRKPAAAKSATAEKPAAAARSTARSTTAPNTTAPAVRSPAPVQARPVTRKAVPAQPAVRVTLPTKLRLRDVFAALTGLRRKRAPSPPLPLAERAWGWLRNVITIGVVVVSLLVMWGAMYALVNPDSSPLMTIRYWQGLDGGRQLHVWKPFEELGETMLLAIVAASDPSFLEEGGLNPDAVKAAVEEGDAGTLGTTALGKLAARELFAWESESFAPRALTAFFSLVAEVSWSKRRIVEVYANLAEFGPGLYGAEAAAQAWYGRSAKELGDVEAAKLAACLADPLHSDPNQPDAGLAARANRILDTMQRMGGTARLREALPPPKSARD